MHTTSTMLCAVGEQLPRPVSEPETPPRVFFYTGKARFEWQYRGDGKGLGVVAKELDPPDALNRSPITMQVGGDCAS